MFLMGQKRLKCHKDGSWKHQEATAHCTKYPDTFRRLISVDLHMLLACFIGMVLWPTIIEKRTLAFSFSALSQILLYLLKIQRRLVKDLWFFFQSNLNSTHLYCTKQVFINLFSLIFV